ncbi:hypothetical protein BVRB_7g179410 [Beta vulgaris subsp. vulgaris]|uniref:Uncharacterized protein n=1 Tax=Beta vulgaris subsp. vulgaris TaxID=3555 RepID=A0A0J8E1Q3_BETVV|nr:hypothetical protein BVRB_7g179410 [Beta vulgaris subsp. vulgaris]
MDCNADEQAANYRDVDKVVETLQLLDIRLDERHAMRMTDKVTNNVGGTPSSVGEISRNCTPTSISTPVNVIATENLSFVVEEGHVVPEYVEDPPRKCRKGRRSQCIPSCIEKKQTGKKKGKVGARKKVDEDEEHVDDGNGQHDPLTIRLWLDLA